MYAIVIDRDEVLVEEFLLEQTLNALPASFRYMADFASLSKGRVVAENGHCTIKFKFFCEDLIILVEPKNQSNFAQNSSSRTYRRLSEALFSISLDAAACA